jgi:hypothetical protein
MKLIAIGVGGSGASCIECLVHLAALGFLEGNVELIPVIVDPDQQHPRIQATSNFIATYNSLRQRGAAATLASGGLLGTKISRIVNTNALRPSDKKNLFELIGLHRANAESLARLFFSEKELGGPKTLEFADGYYGRVNAGVCFFNDPAGRRALLEALREHVLSGDAAIALVGSSFGGTGAAGLIHLARVFREDEKLRNVRFSLGAIQLEPYFQPDQAEHSRSDLFLNDPDTFEGRTGSAYRFLAGLADSQNVPFDVLYPLGVRTPTTFPPAWFRKDQQNNPHLFIEYLAALATRDFATNHADLRNVVRHRREAVPPFEGPLAVLRKFLYDATALQRLLSSYILPLLRRVGESRQLPGHPWIWRVSSAAGLSGPDLTAHFAAVCDLLTDILVSAGIDREATLLRAGPAEDAAATAEAKNQRTRDSFPLRFAPLAENFDLAASLRDGDPDELFETYEISHDAKLPARALQRWVEGAARLPPEARHAGEVFHQWTQQEGATIGSVLGVQIPPDDEFQSDPLPVIVSRLAAAGWRRPASPRSTAEYPSIWAPALVHRDELYSGNPSTDRRFLQLGLIASALVRQKHLASAPVRLIKSGGLHEAFQRSLESTLPIADRNGSMIAIGGVVAIYESSEPLPQGSVPSPSDVLGFFYPDTIVVPAAGISGPNEQVLIDFGQWAAGRGLAQLLLTRLADTWVETLEACGIPDAADRGTQFIMFLESFKQPITDEPLTPSHLYNSCPEDDAAMWIQRLYQ